MIIKLAYYDEQNQENDIRTCCDSNNSFFISLFKNKFGILAVAPYDHSYGRGSADEECGFRIQKFIDIYNCVDQLEKNKFRNRIWKRNAIPYVGELLDNKFFLNILFIIFSDNKNNIELDYLKVITAIGNYKEIADHDEFKMRFKGGQIKRILKLSFILEGQYITVNKNGYIGISSDIEFVKKNCELIKGLIINGFRGEYGKYYL